MLIRRTTSFVGRVMGSQQPPVYRTSQLYTHSRASSGAELCRWGCQRNVESSKPKYNAHHASFSGLSRRKTFCFVFSCFPYIFQTEANRGRRHAHLAAGRRQTGPGCKRIARRQGVDSCKYSVYHGSLHATNCPAGAAVVLAVRTLQPKRELCSSRCSTCVHRR